MSRASGEMREIAGEGGSITLDCDRVRETALAPGQV
jgi:hypothetical protein